MFEVLGQVAFGWFAIDFLSGIYHFVIDHRKPTDPIIGKQVADFQEHHKDPHSMEKHGFWFRNWQTMLGSTPALIFACYGLPWFWVTVWLGGFVCQQVHHWAHVDSPPFFAKMLQQAGLFISHERHMDHHNDFERSYGILNGWSHGIMDLMLGRIW